MSEIKCANAYITSENKKNYQVNLIVLCFYFNSSIQLNYTYLNNFTFYGPKKRKDQSLLAVGMYLSVYKTRSEGPDS